MTLTDKQRARIIELLDQIEKLITNLRDELGTTESSERREPAEAIPG